MTAWWLTLCEKAGEEVLVTDGYRSAEEQNNLHDQGRSKPGKIVTNAKGGQSFHQYRVAIDFCPSHGAVLLYWDRDRFFRCAALAKACGFEWSERDMPHLQYRDGLSIADFRDGKTVVRTPLLLSEVPRESTIYCFSRVLVRLLERLSMRV